MTKGDMVDQDLALKELEAKSGKAGVGLKETKGGCVAKDVALKQKGQGRCRADLPAISGSGLWP